MAWNEPGGNRDSGNRGSGNRDPWGNRGDDGGPPDLDEALRKAKKRLQALFGGGKKGSRPGGDRGSAGGGGGLSPTLAWIGLGIAVLLWLASGFFVTDAADRSVVTRFGAFVREVGPGPHWHLPWPIARVRTVNVAENRSLSIDTESMLTQDENVVVLDMSVQYDVKDVKAFLFNVKDPERTLHQVIESELRSVAGDRDMDAIITKQRGEVASRIQRQAQAIVDSYGSGLNIQAVNLEQAQPPDPVQPAYQDAINAREDQKRFVNKAHAIRNRIIPKARGQAAETVQQAKAYRTRVVESAHGDANRFDALLAKYREAPKVTRKRLYLDTMQDVFENTGKVLIDRGGKDGGRNMIYLPLDRMTAHSSGSSGNQSDSGQLEMPTPPVKGGAVSRNRSSTSSRSDRSRGSIE